MSSASLSSQGRDDAAGAPARSPAGLSRSLQRTLVRNTVTSWANNAVAVGTTLLLTPLVLRSLGAPAYGVWMLLIQLAGYTGLIDMGIQQAVAKRVAGSRATPHVQLDETLSAALLLQS